MNNNTSVQIKENLVFMTLIVGRKQQDSILNALQDSGIRLINTIYGRGTANATYLQAAFGLVPEKHKVVITCISTCSKTDAVFKMLCEKFNFDKPNTGIAFTTPIDGLSF